MRGWWRRSLPSCAKTCETDRRSPDGKPSVPWCGVEHVWRTAQEEGDAATVRKVAERVAAASREDQSEPPRVATSGECSLASEFRSAARRSPASPSPVRPSDSVSRSPSRNRRPTQRTARCGSNVVVPFQSLDRDEAVDSCSLSLSASTSFLASERWKKLRETCVRVDGVRQRLGVESESPRRPSRRSRKARGPSRPTVRRGRPRMRPPRLPGRVRRCERRWVSPRRRPAPTQRRAARCPSCRRSSRHDTARGSPVAPLRRSGRASRRRGR